MLIAAGDNHDHLRDEASFAALCGVSPVERSSGKNQTPTPQPRREPAGQRRPLLHRALPSTLGGPPPRLPPATHRGGQDRPRGHPLPH
ncbi:transposase [Streptomyces sp. NPDC055966]|uniref:transposase n=1 Tax=unclassified Streptomyces TaxID=2593676 RepID=UPI0035D856AF